MNEQTTVMPPASEADDIRLSMRAAREMIPVGPRGTMLVNFAQQVDFAQSMAKARYSVPEFLQGNVGDCLAIIDIASRADLSPYMLAMKTYVDPSGKKLCFESQAYHALAMPWLAGDFEITYEGEGETLVCVVSGYLKHDPAAQRKHKSEPLSKARPPRNEKGNVKGSPLWDKKPKVQLAYDTIRDWVRIYCPRATLGIYTPDEIEEYAGAASRDVTPPGLAARIVDHDGTRTEGHRDGHVDAELAQIASAGNRVEILPADPSRIIPAEVQPGEQPFVPGENPVSDGGGEPNRTESHAKGKGKGGKKASKSPSPKAVPKQPTDSAEYAAYAGAWIEAVADREDAWGRWEGEREMREELRVPIKMRNELMARITDKFPAQGEG